MFNILASQLKPLKGGIFVHFINEATFRAVFLPHDADSPIKQCEEKSEHSFEHAFYLLYAKLAKDQSMLDALKSTYDHLPMPGIARITSVKTRVDALLVSPFVTTAIVIYCSGDRVIAQVEWMGTKTEIPGCRSICGTGRNVQEAIDNALKEEPLNHYCYVPHCGEKKEPVSL